MNNSSWHKEWLKTGKTTKVKVQPSLDTSIQNTSVNTSALPVHEQFAFWNEYGANIGALSREGDARRAFHAHSETYYTPLLTYAQHSTSCKSKLIRSKYHAEKIDADLLVIQLRLAGCETWHQFNTDRLFQTGDIRIMDLSQTYASENEGYNNIGVFVNKSELRDYVPDLETLHGYTLPETPLNSFLRNHFKSTFDTLPELNRLEADQISKITLDTVIAALMSNAIPKVYEAEFLAAPARRLVHDYIKRNLADTTLSPEKIAHSVGMSRAKLYRLCKPYGSPMEMVRLARLRAGRDLLQSKTVRSVEEAAYMVGYRNRSHFSRDFHREFGVAARDYLYSD